MNEKKYILICEDNKSLNHSLANDIQNECTNNGFSVEIISTYTRKSTLEVISNKYFSLAIVDLNLNDDLPLSWKDTDGVKIIEELNRKSFGTKVIVASANPETELVFDLTKTHGIDQYVSKSGSIDAFSTMINIIMETLEKTSLPSPIDPLEVLSDLKSIDKFNFEEEFCNVLNISYASKQKIAKTVINKIYPCEYREEISKSKYIINNNSHYFNATLWSYRYSCFVGILIIQNKVPEKDYSSFIKVPVIDTIFEKRISNVNIKIYKLDI